MSLTDDQLIASARAGDRKAFHLLVDRYAPRLYQLAAIMTGNFNDAQDLVQETLLGAWQALPGFEGKSTAKTWFTGIMIRQASLARRKTKRSRMDSLDHAASQEPQDHRPAAANSVARSDARIDLMTLMQGLSIEHREVIVLRELQGLSYDEIAQMINQPRGTVESRLFRARHALKQLAAASNTTRSNNPSQQPTPGGEN